MRMYLFVLFLAIPLARADEALDQTQALLRDPTARAAATRGDAKAQALQKNIDTMSGAPANSEKIYGLSAEVFAELVAKTGGDVGKLQQLLSDAQKNPEAFANSLSPEIKEKIRGVASDIEQTQKAHP
jgi:hypothetical protein